MTSRVSVLLVLNLIGAMVLGAVWLARERSAHPTCAVVSPPLARPLGAAVVPSEPPGHRDHGLLNQPRTVGGAPRGDAGVVREWTATELLAEWQVQTANDAVRWSVELASPLTYDLLRLTLRGEGIRLVRLEPVTRDPSGQEVRDQLVREVQIPPGTTGELELTIPVRGGSPGNYRGHAHVALTVEVRGAVSADSLRAVAMQTPAAALGDSFGVQGVPLGGEERPSWSVPAGMSATIELPDMPWQHLEMAVGGLERPHGEIRLEPSGRVLWEGVAPQAWQPVVVRLDEPVHGGALSVRASGSGVMVVGHPRLTTPEPDEATPDVLLYLVDTLRADRLGAWGYAGTHTPVLDRLAAEGVQFARAQSVSSWTKPSVPSILTGLGPLSHRVRLGQDTLADGFETLAERMQEGGWRTGGFVASPLRVDGLARGFDRVAYPDRWADQLGPMGHPTASQLHDALTDWIDERPARPFFALVHSMEVHEYRRHEVFGLDRPYDAAVEAADRELGTLLERLGERRSRPLLVVFVSDHGERLGERDGAFGHGLDLYQEELHIPLILWRSDTTWAGTVTHPVSNLDVTPTLLSMVGLPPLKHADGVDLTTWLRPGEHVRRPPVMSRLVEFYWTPGTPERHARLDGQGLKLIHGAGGRFEAYQLQTDACEVHPLDDTPHRDVMHRAMAEVVEAGDQHAARRGPTDSPATHLHADEVEGLEALGYLSAD